MTSTYFLFPENPTKKEKKQVFGPCTKNTLTPLESNWLTIPKSFLQGTLYLHTIHTPDAKTLLESTITALLQVAPITEEGGGPAAPSCLYQLYYEQQSSRSSPTAPASQPESQYLDFPTPSVSLTFDDTTLEPVRQAWARIMGHPAEDDDVQFMVFEDREGVGDDDDLE